MTTGTHKEMTTGVSGNGSTVYMVNTVCNVTGRWIHTEKFSTAAEAKSWMKWA